MNREISFCSKLNLFECKNKYGDKTYFSADEIYFSRIRGEEFREYLDDEVSTVGQ